MQKLSEVLEAARRHVAGGWHEPLSLAADGRICSSADEGITQFCVADAIEVAAGGAFILHVEAELELAKQLRLRGEQRSITTWLEDQHTLHGDVLQLFTTAAAHARAEESR